MCQVCYTYDLILSKILENMGTVIPPFINEKNQDSTGSYKMKEQDFTAN